MTRIRAAMTALLAAGVTMLATGQANAQGRGPSAKSTQDRAPANVTAERASQFEKLNAWPRGLVGNFQIAFTTTGPGVITQCAARTDNLPGARCLEERTVVLSPIKHQGYGECRAIGSGPGVSCLFNWNGEIAPVTAMFLPMAIMYGVDPDDPGFRFLHVNSSGQALEARGSADGKTATFKRECAKRRDSRPCTRITWSINAPPNGKRITILISVFNGSVAASGGSGGNTMQIELLREP